MEPIPLAPIHPKTELPEAEGGVRKRRPGRFRRTARYLVSPLGTWSGVGTIRKSAGLIGDTIEEARAAARRDPRFRVRDDGRFDVEMTARMFGMSVAEIERRLSGRRRQSAMIAYLCLVLAFGALLTWLGTAFGGRSEPASFMLTFNVFGFCGICSLAAFYQGLVNFQLRSERAASWKDYLVTERGFWPRP